MQLKIIINIIT